MKIIQTKLKGVMIIEPRVFKDPRGYFMEVHQYERYRKNGINSNFVQDNLSYSIQNTLRGLHYQHPHPQVKLVNAIRGKVFDVAVDIRQGSPTFGQWEGVVLSSDNHRQLIIPEGFAHGFCVLSEYAIFSYKCSDVYTPEAECGIAWNDPQIGIKWPLKNPLLSENDKEYPCLEDLPAEKRPVYSNRSQGIIL